MDRPHSTRGMASRSVRHFAAKPSCGDWCLTPAVAAGRRPSCFRPAHCEGAMRAIFQPLMVVVAVVIVGFGGAEACRLALMSVSELQPVVARCCGNCRTTQSVETDLPFWSCQRCRQYHWLNSGEISAADVMRVHAVKPGVARPTGLKLSREPADLAATSGSAREGDRRGNRVWDASRRRSPRTPAG